MSIFTAQKKQVTGMEKAPNRELAIVGFVPISSAKQPCDLGQDTCFTSAALSVNTVCIWECSGGARWTRCPLLRLLFPSLGILGFPQFKEYMDTKQKTVISESRWTYAPVLSPRDIVLYLPHCIWSYRTSQSPQNTW